MSNPEMDKKQAYLRTEIMETGYDTEQFVVLMGSRKESGEDLDNWTFAELHDIVEEFRESERKRKLKAPEEEKVRAKEGVSNGKGAIPAPANLVDQNNEVGLYREKFPYSIRTQVRDSNELTGNEIKSKIVETKVINKGIFSNGHVLYKINTLSKGWSVERKYKEFRELRVELERLYPGSIVPPIYVPANEAETSPAFVSAVRPVLQQFLDDVLRHPLLGCSELVYYFLHHGMEAGKKVDEFFKRVRLYSMMPAPKEIEETRTEHGTAIVALTPELTSQIAHLCVSSPKLRTLYGEAQTLNKSMETLVEKLSETIQKQVEVYKEIASYYKLLKQPKMANAFETVQTMLAKIDNSYFQIMRMVGEVFKPLTRQLYHEQAVVDMKAKEINTFHEHLCATERKLCERKIDLFEKQLISKWDLSPNCAIPMDTLFTNRIVAIREILTTESHECSKLRVVYGYMCNKLSEEFDQLCEKDAGQAAFSILFTAKICRDTAKEVHTMWCDLAEKYTAMQRITVC